MNNKNPRIITEEETTEESTRHIIEGIVYFGPLLQFSHRISLEEAKNLEKLCDEKGFFREQKIIQHAPDHGKLAYVFEDDENNRISYNIDDYKKLGNPRSIKKTIKRITVLEPII